MNRLADWRFWLGLLIGLAALWWAFSRVDTAALGEALARAEYWYLAPAGLLIIAQYPLRALRWRYFLDPLGTTPYRHRERAVALGFGANWVLPARLGEVIRAVELGRRTGWAKSSILATILLERVVDGMVVVPLFLGSAWWLGALAGDSVAAQMLRSAITTFSLVYLLCLTLVLGLALRPEATTRFLGSLLNPLPDSIRTRILSVVENISAGLGLLRRPRLFLGALLETLIIWLVIAAPLFLLAGAVGHPVSFIGALFVNGLISLAVAIPAAPGYIGTFHYAIQTGFSDLLGMSPEAALAAAIIYHGATLVLTLAYAGLVLLRPGGSARS